MNIYITFDYELFLSSNTGSVDNCLIKPTKSIIDICNKFNVRTTFFVDTTYLCKAREYKQLENEYSKVREQIKTLSAAGHSIQLHIHPQWFYSSYSEDSGWDMDYDHYKLSDCPIDDVHKMFDDGIALIEEITGNACNAYRAGGYSIQTLPNYADFLRSKEIVVDSSCLCGKASKSVFHEYNYKSIKDSNIFKFNNCIECKEEDGELYELPITTFKINPIKYLIKKRNECRERIVKFGDGKGVYSKLPLIKKILKKIKMLLFPLYISASIDRQTGVMLETIYNQIKKKGYKEMTVIVHPKETTNYSLYFLEKFLTKALNDRCKFKTIDDIK